MIAYSNGLFFQQMDINMRSSKEKYAFAVLCDTPVVEIFLQKIDQVIFVSQIALSAALILLNVIYFKPPFFDRITFAPDKFRL